MGGAAAGIGEVVLFERGDFVSGEEREEFEVADDVAVVGLDPELVELVDAGAARVEPDGAALGFSEFGAVGFGDERECQAPCAAVEFFANEVHACGDVAPLVAAADLEFAAVDAGEVVEVVGLEEHVAEFRVADANLAVFHACADGFFGDHLIDGEVLADVAEEVEEADGAEPVGVVDEASGVGGGVEVEEACELGSDGGDVGGDLVFGEELAFLGFAAGVADAAGGAAGDGDGVVAGELEAAEGDEGDETAGVETIGGGVEAAVEGDWVVEETLGEPAGAVTGFGAAGVVVDEAAPLKFCEDVHEGGRGKDWRAVAR